MRVLTIDDIAPLDELPLALLDEMHDAGRLVLECERVLAEAGGNVVSELLTAAEEFFQWDHYPEGDVFCPDSHAQYYYHSHPPDVRDNTWGDEHGHFHTFLRPAGFPNDVLGEETAACGPDLREQNPPSHLVAISMGFDGRANRLFTTNRWVTGEAWYDAGVVKRLLEHFHIGHGNPSPATNDWVSAMLVLFRPTVEALLHARDEILSAHDTGDGDTDVFDDKNLEVTSIVDVDVDRQVAAVEEARRRRR